MNTVKLLQPVRPHIQEGNAKLTHQPLVGSAAGEVHAGLFDIDGNSPSSLNNIGVHEHAFRMSDIAKGLKIVLVPSSAGNKRYGDKARVL